MSIPTHLWVSMDGDVCFTEGAAGIGSVRHKLVPDPEPEPPERPELVWFEYQGGIYYGMRNPDFTGNSYAVSPKFNGGRLLHDAEIRDFGIQLRTDFEEESE